MTAPSLNLSAETFCVNPPMLRQYALPDLGALPQRRHLLLWKARIARFSMSAWASSWIYLDLPGVKQQLIGHR